MGTRRSLVPAVLRQEPQFRLLFAGQALSVLGDRTMMLVLPFAVLGVGGGAIGVVIVSIAQFVPFLLLALPAGVLADRVDRRVVMVVSDVLRFLVQLVAGLALLGGHGSVPLLAALAVVFGAADAFFQPASTGLLPAVVAPEQLQSANALRGLTYSIGSIAGPAVGGALLATVGTGGAFVFDSGTFLVSAVTLLILRPRRTAERASARTHVVAEFVAGAAAVVSRPWVVVFLVAGAAYAILVLPAITVLGPVLSADRFGGPSGWAIITAGFGCGALVGDLVLLRWRPRFALRVSALALIGASCQALVIGSGLGTWPVAAIEFGAGICVTMYFSLWETSLQEHVPEAELSRVSSYDYLTAMGALPVGSVAAAALIAWLGPGVAILVLGTAGLLVACTVIAVPTVRRLPRGSAAVDRSRRWAVRRPSRERLGMRRRAGQLPRAVTDPVKVDVWSDVACPWCYIGKRRFEAGARAAGVPVEVEYHSFELSPDTPVDFEGSAIEFLSGHKGIPFDHARAMTDQVSAIAAEVGLDYSYDDIRHTRTLRAHELLHFAKAQGRQLDVAEALFRAYFVEGRHVGRIDDLVALAEEVGLDGAAARAALADHRYEGDVQADLAQAVAYGIGGVPFFVIDGRYGVSGAQAPELFAGALARVVDERAAAR